MVLFCCKTEPKRSSVSVCVWADMVVYEYELRIGWGKAVSLPSNALPAPPPGQMAVIPKEFDVHGNAAIAWSEPGGGAAAALGLTGLNTEVVSTRTSHM